jgi:hypothetical protein
MLILNLVIPLGNRNPGSSTPPVEKAATNPTFAVVLAYILPESKVFNKPQCYTDLQEMIPAFRTALKQSGLHI